MNKQNKKNIELVLCPAVEFSENEQEILSRILARMIFDQVSSKENHQIKTNGQNEFKQRKIAEN